MDPISFMRNRAVKSTPATTKSFYGQTWVTDNVNDKTVFAFIKNEQLAVPPYTANSTVKYAETTGFSDAVDDWSGFTHAFAPTNWGSGNYHSQSESWEVNRITLPTVPGAFAANADRSIIVAYGGGNVKPKVSTDFGSTWIDANTTLPNNDFPGILFAEGAFYVAYSNGQGVWTSVDGMTWTSTSSILNSNYLLKAGAPGYTVIGDVIFSAGRDYFSAQARIGGTNYVFANFDKVYDGNRSLRFVTKTVNYEQTNNAVLVISNKVYSVTWDGTAPTATEVFDTDTISRSFLAIAWDEVNNRYISIMAGSSWTTGNEIRTSSDNGATWTLLKAIPDAYSNRSFIVVLANGKIVISGNGGSDVIYSPDTDTFNFGSRFKMTGNLRLTETRFLISAYNMDTNSYTTYASDSAAATDTTSILSKRKWFTQTWAGQANVIITTSSDTLRTSSNTNVTFSGTKDYPNDKGLYPSYFNANSVTQGTYSSGGLNYDTTSYLCMQDTAHGNYSQNTPQYVANIWKSTDNGVTFERSVDYTNKVTSVDTISHQLSNNPNSNWTEITKGSSNNPIFSFSRILWSPNDFFSTLDRRINSVSPAGLNEMFYQDGAYWAYGHNGVLMTSTTGNSGWTKFDNLQKLCFGTRITAFAKNGNNLIVFTNLYSTQCLYSTDLGVTWTDYTTAFRTAWGISFTGWNINKDSVATACIWDGTQWIVAAAGASSGSLLVSTNGSTWTKKTSYPSNFSTIPMTITKHPTDSTILIGCRNAGIVVTNTSLATFTTLGFSSYGFSSIVTKIIWNGSTWFAFFETGSQGRYTYSTVANPTSLANWKSPLVLADFPATRRFGGTTSTLNATNAYWDGTNILIVDYYNRKAFKSPNGDNWTEMTGLYSNTLWKKFSKHPWAIASNGTMYVAVGDMCDSGHSTDGGSNWSTNAGTKIAAGVEDPTASLTLDTYIASTLTITNGGSGYPPNESNLAVTVTFSNPTGTPAVKPITGTIMTNSSGAISQINIDNYGFVSGYTTAPIITSITGSTGSGATATATLLYKLGATRMINLGKGLGPTYSTYASFPSTKHDQFEIGVVPEYPDPTGIPGVSLNSTPTRIRFALGNKRFTNTGFNSGASLLSGNDSGSMIINSPSGSGVFFSGVNYSILNSFSNGQQKTSCPVSYKSIYTSDWICKEFAPTTTKPLTSFNASSPFVDNTGAPYVFFNIEKRVFASNISIFSGGFNYNTEITTLVSAIQAEYTSSNNTLKFTPSLYKYGIETYGSFISEDNPTSIIANLPVDMSLKLTGTDLDSFRSNNQIYITTPFVFVACNGGNENTPGNTVVITMQKPKTYPMNDFTQQQPNSVNEVYWFKSTNGGSSWTDISAPIRAKYNTLGIIFSQQKYSVALPLFMNWSQHEQVWYSITQDQYVIWSRDLTNWTVARDPAIQFPDYPD
jgi:hypothetical protein